MKFPKARANALMWVVYTNFPSPRQFSLNPLSVVWQIVLRYPPANFYAYMGCKRGYLH